jgi:hypothetical protein
VRQLKAIVIVVMTLFWSVVSSHALLEFAGVIHHHHVAEHAHSPDAHGHDSDEHQTDTHEAADGKYRPSSVRVSAPTPKFFTLLPFTVPELESLPEPPAVRQSFGSALPGVAPPQHSHRWQFSFRAALPPRAPSLIS